MRNVNTFGFAILMVLLSINSIWCQPMITEWQTSNPGVTGDSTIQIPLISANDPQDPITINWGDGIVEDSAVSPFIHTYPDTGTYEVVIHGGHHGMIFNNEGDKEKIIRVFQWGDAEWQSMAGAFYGCSNLAIVTYDDSPDISTVVDMSFAFADVRSIAIGLNQVWSTGNVENMSGVFIGCSIYLAPLNSWDVSSVTNMSMMFEDAFIYYNLGNPDSFIGGWDVGNVTNMSRMFYESKEFNQDIGSWNVSNVTDMSYMFGAATTPFMEFDQDIGSWDVSNVTNMSNMFSLALNFNQDLGDWNVGNVTDMSYMFYVTWFDQEIGSWNTSSVISMRGMFRSSSFNQDIGSWDVGSVTDMSYMFYRAHPFNQDIGDWHVSNVENMSHMFGTSGAANTQFNQDIGSWDVGSVTDMEGMFSRAALFDQDIGSWNTASVLNMSGMFRGSGFNHDISNWDVSNVQNMSLMFAREYGPGYQGSAFNQPIGTWNVSGVTNMESMFNGTLNFDQPIGDWDVSTVTNMRFMFSNAVEFNQYLGDWNVSGVKDMTGMFSHTGAFNTNIANWSLDSLTSLHQLFAYSEAFDQDVSELDLGNNILDLSNIFQGAVSFNQDLNNWDVSNVQNMTSLFSETEVFNKDINSWNVSNVQYMGGMFAGALSFNQDIGSWDVSDVTEMWGMFHDAIAFNQDIGGWDVSNVTSMISMFDNSGLSTRNYDKILQGWATQTVQNGVSFSAGTTNYCVGEPGRMTLINTYGWNITDGGKDCSKTHFITTWVIPFNPGDPNNLDITIPTRPGLTYDYDVDWTGDGVWDDLGVTGNITHTYGGIGQKEIHIKGTFPQIYFWAVPTDKLLQINQWGSIEWESMQRSFYQCKDLQIVAEDDPDLTNVTDLSYMFQDCENLIVDVDNPLGRWYLGNVTTVYQMFYDATNFNSPLNGWFTGSITNMSGMFWNAANFNQDIGSWNVSSVINMSTMFYNATDFNIDLSAWDVSSVSNMASMFNGASAYQGTGINNWNTSSLTSLSSTFKNAISFNAPLDNWDVISLTFMPEAFSGATTFNQDLSNWDVSSLANSGFTNAMYNAFLNTNLSTENYDAMLIAWSRLQSPPSNMSPTFTPAEYCLADRAIDSLTTVNNWSITDGGLDPGCVCPGYTKFVNGAWDSGAPEFNTTAVIEGAYDTGTHGTFDACNLLIRDTGSLTVQSTDTLNILNKIHIEGEISVDPGGRINVDD